MGQELREMRIEKKKIDMKAGASILEKLNDPAEGESVVSLGKFIAENCNILRAPAKASGKSTNI
jgi:hypothetical protein